jgi:hypothetical protein
MVMERTLYGTQHNKVPTRWEIFQSVKHEKQQDGLNHCLKCQAPRRSLRHKSQVKHLL